VRGTRAARAPRHTQSFSSARRRTAVPCAERCVRVRAAVGVQNIARAHCQFAHSKMLPAPGHRVAYVIFGNPFFHKTHTDGPAHVPNMVRLHLWAIAQLRTRLSAVFVALPHDSKKIVIANYTDFRAEAALLPCKVHVLQLTNNTLGTYGMFLHAFATTRGEHDYYMYAEADMIPVRRHFDELYVEMYSRAFAHGEPGMLVGSLQGKPAEPYSHFPLHGQNQHIMSANSIDAVFRHVFVTMGWKQSAADYIVHLQTTRGTNRKFARHVFDQIQEGFGLLLSEANISMRDHTATFRSPYWNSNGYTQIWSGALTNFSLPMDRVLIVPVQMLFDRRLRRCCGVGSQSCKDSRATCMVNNWLTDVDCCLKRKRAVDHVWHTRAFANRQVNNSVPPTGALTWDRPTAQWMTRAFDSPSGSGGGRLRLAEDEPVHITEPQPLEAG
jgi:hypothetical protein